MPRYDDEQKRSEPLSPEETIRHFERIHQRKLAAGEVIQMMRREPIRNEQGERVGWDWVARYVDNTEKAIARKLRQGFVHCDIEEQVVKTPVPKPKLAADKPALKSTASKAKE